MACAQLEGSHALCLSATVRSRDERVAASRRGQDGILGFTMIGAEAGEVVAAVQTAMLAELPYGRLRDIILAHPTIAEGLGLLFSNVSPRAAQRPNAQERTLTA